MGVTKKTDITIRECVPEDSTELARINRTRLGYDYPEELTHKKIEALAGRNDCRIFVAEMDGRVVGYVHAADYDVLYYPAMKNILGIAVDEDYLRRGIGRRLLGEVERWAKETGAAAVRLNSGSSRTQAHCFYRSCGYTSDKTQLRFIKKTEG